MLQQAIDNKRGMLAMIAAMAAFAINDAMMKYLAASLPVSEIMLLRGIVAAVLIAGVMWRTGDLVHFHEARRGPVLLRAFFEAAVTIVYVTALRSLPLGLVTSILQATPLIMTAMAASWGRETVGWRRWSAVAVGFGGILLIAQPSPHGVEPAMGLALLAAFLVTFRDLSTRLVPPRVPSLVIVLAASLGSTAAGGVVALNETWLWPGQHETILICAAAVTVLAGNLFITIAFRGTEVSAVSPFRYAAVPFALLIGYLVWRDIPNALATCGIVLVVGAGLYAMHREALRLRAGSAVKA
ncbi:MAG: ribN 2, partial [Hyphomicrobiales bacterium]|nr:ribN 2 [Hyphomicrobiales bacterium]